MPKKLSRKRIAKKLKGEHSGSRDTDQNLGFKLLEQALEGSRDLLESLNPAEKKMAVKILEEMVEDPELSSYRLDHIWELDYHEKPVTIEEFLDNDYFFGKYKKHLWDCWREDLLEIFREGSKCYEWVLGGAIGTGKSTAAGIAFVYPMYRMSLLKNPHHHYDLLEASKLTFGIYSLTLSQVHDVGYYKIRTYISECPYFLERFPFQQRKLSTIDFYNKKMIVEPGSKSFHAIGKDVFSFYMDEVNFSATSGNQAKQNDKVVTEAQTLYNTCRKRVVSRFMRDGAIPGMMYLISSKQSTTSFLEQHIKECKEELNDGRVHLSEHSLWGAMPPTRFKKMYTSGKFFKVEVGDKIWPSRILEKDDQPRPGAEILDVPEEHKKDFQQDCEQSLRDIGGRATHGLSPFIRDRSVLYACIDKTMEHPFTRKTITISTKDDFNISDYFIPEKMMRIHSSHYVMLRNPLAPRFFHLDLALTADCAGFCLGHVSGMTRKRIQRSDGTFYDDIVPEIVIDFFLQIAPPAKQRAEIDLSKIRSFILDLKDMGVPIIKGSADGWNSPDTCQIMDKAGVPMVTQSVDKYDAPYMSLRTAIYENRIYYYEYEPFMGEMRNLERDADTSKIDHPKWNEDGSPGSKDVSDAAAGVVHLCINEPSATELVNFYTGTTIPGDIHDGKIATRAGALDWGKIKQQRLK